MGMALDTQSEVSDADLLAAFGKGDQSAARTLTGRHLPRVFAHAYRLLQDHAEAEDVAQEAAPEPEDDTPSVEAGLIAEDRQKALQAAMQSLPERQRNALVLRHFEELSNPEIASALETSVEAVESLLGRARRALADRLSHLRPVARRVKQKKGART